MLKFRNMSLSRRDFSKHPSYFQMIKTALIKLNDHESGSSKTALLHYIFAHYDVDPLIANQNLKFVLKNGLKRNYFIQTSGRGMNGSFKLGFKTTTTRNVPTKSKSLITHVQSDTCARFEDIANEILYDIFDYLHPIQVVYTFRNLNQRFSCLIDKYTKSIDLSSIPYQLLQEYYTQSPDTRSVKLGSDSTLTSTCLSSILQNSSIASLT
ncbi:unnamed protein product, partial [Didymodactylos carnosus]